MTVSQLHVLSIDDCEYRIYCKGSLWTILFMEIDVNLSLGRCSPDRDPNTGRQEEEADY
jgi:hypothetical protein